MKVADPRLLYAKWLKFSEREFKHTRPLLGRRTLRDLNRSLLVKKSLTVSVMTTLFAIELLLLFAWVVTA